MNFKNIFSFLLLCLSILTLNSCTKEEGPLTDRRPENSIIVTNAAAYRPEPTVLVSKNVIVSPGVTGPIQIVLSLPASSNRQIKSISKVAASTTFTQIQSTGTTGFYNTAAIAGSGKTATFFTTLTEFTTKTGLATPASNTELARRFYFLVILDDDSQIVTEPVRVLVQD